MIPYSKGDRIKYCGDTFEVLDVHPGEYGGRVELRLVAAADGRIVLGHNEPDPTPMADPHDELRDAINKALDAAGDVTLWFATGETSYGLVVTSRGHPHVRMSVAVDVYPREHPFG